MDTATRAVEAPNDRVIIGGNLPPEETPREKHSRLSREFQAEVAAFQQAHPNIKTKDVADKAGELTKKGIGLRTAADKDREIEKEPHLKAGREVDKYYNQGVIKRITDCEDALKPLLRAWLNAERDRIAAEQAAARKAAEEARLAAEAQAEKAFEAYDAAERGKGTGNHLAEVEKARVAQEEAEAAAEDAARMERMKARAGAKGARVSLRTVDRVVMALPANAPTKVQAIALSKMVPFIVDELGIDGLDALRKEIGRLANVAYKKSKNVAPGCTVVQEDNVQ
ncbi:MAG: hypothetical protein AB7O57_08325 [Hyphomicrobiaceae bacterium]